MKIKFRIERVINNINFSKKYIKLCNRYADIDNGVTYKKNEILRILENVESNLKYSSKEKLFFNDYKIGNTTIRIVVTYKYGFIDCMYIVWTDGFKDRVRGSLSEIATIEDHDFENKAKNKFPIATSLGNLESILLEITQLNKDFILEYSKNIEIFEEE